MSFLPPQLQALVPWDNLQDFVDDWTKGLQEIADLIDPDKDNSNKVISPGTQFNTPIFWKVPVNQLTHNYDDIFHGYGNAPYLVASSLSVSGSEVTLGGFTVLGKLYAGGWYNLNASDKEYVDGLINSLNFGTKMTVHNDGNHLILTNMSPGSNTLDLIPYDALPSYVYYQWYSIDDTFVKGNLGVTFKNYELTMNEDQPDVYGSIKVVGYNEQAFPAIGGATKPIAPYSQPLVGMIENQDVINYYITNNGSTNNYHKTQDGYDIYYGDNYYIIKPNNQPVTYNKVYNVMVNTLPDVDPTIKVPTYDDNKYPDIEDDDQDDGGVYGPADFCHLYACTKSELNNLQLWMSGGAAGSSGDSPVTVPDNFDPMAQVVGLIGYPIEIDTGVGDDTTFTFRSADNQTVNTGWATKKLGIVEREIDMGSVTVTPWGKEKKKVPWLDYSATVECYIPFCGPVPLDPQSVMGCTLTCKMWVNFATGDVSAIIYSDINGGQHPVAYASGNCGASQPISAAAFGSLMGARAAADHKMTQAVLGGVKNAVTGTVNTAVANYARGAGQFNLPVPAGQGSGLASQIANAGGMIMGSKYGAMSAITSAVDLGVNLTLQNLDNRYNYTVAKNSLGTTIAGSFGQTTSWHYENHCYIKVTWPTPKSDTVTNYGRTYGVPVHKSGTVGEYSGYTVCNNVDCSGITKATVSEQALIKQYLESGVYVNGGES